MKEEVRKSLYKVEILFIKIIPIIIAGCCLLNTIMSYIGIKTELLTYIAGIGILPIAFFYLTSYVFKFCEYHRMFLHYIVVNNIICYIDYVYEIPVSDKQYLILHFMIAGIFMFLIIYLKFKLCKKL